MRWPVGPCALAGTLLLTFGLASARALEKGDAPFSVCENAIQAAERRYEIPPGLLRAIGLVETSRVDATGTRHSWPWAANAEGVGRYFASKAEGVEWVRSKLASGIASVDVGCLQVNLRDHPTAFASLDEAFDPGFNADYAARFLASLHVGAPPDSGWMRSAGRYHSGTKDLAAPYQQAVEQAYGQVVLKTRIAAIHGGKPRPSYAERVAWARRRAEAALLVAGVAKRGPEGNRVDALIALALAVGVPVRSPAWR